MSLRKKNGLKLRLVVYSRFFSVKRYLFLVIYLTATYLKVIQVNNYWFVFFCFFFLIRISLSLNLLLSACWIDSFLQLQCLVRKRMWLLHTPRSDQSNTPRPSTSSHQIHWRIHGNHTLMIRVWTKFLQMQKASVEFSYLWLDGLWQFWCKGGDGKGIRSGFNLFLWQQPLVILIANN